MKIKDLDHIDLHIEPVANDNRAFSVSVLHGGVTVHQVNVLAMRVLTPQKLTTAVEQKQTQ